MQSAAGTGGSIVDRVLGVIQLKKPVFEEIEHDTNATGQALVVVIAAAIAAAIGGIGDANQSGWLWQAIASVAGWIVFSVVAFYVGTSFFRSPQPQRSWVTAAGAVLDAVSLAGAVLRRGPSPQERLTLRAGAFALRRIAEFFDVEFDPQPDPKGPVSVRRHEFDAAYQRLVRADVEVQTEPEQAWADFVAARAQYDEVLLALAGLLVLFGIYLIVPQFH